MGRAVCVGACLWAALAGCSTRQANRSGEGAQPSASIVPASPFEPRTLQIYPLTHLTRDAAGLGMIVLHVEIKDAWGDSVKWPGVLAVMLMGPGGQRTAPWRIDLSDPEKNSGAFDPVTRTYRIQLGGLPDWLKARSGRRGSRTCACTRSLRSAARTRGSASFRMNT